MFNNPSSCEIQVTGRGREKNPYGWVCTTLFVPDDMFVMVFMLGAKPPSKRIGNHEKTPSFGRLATRTSGTTFSTADQLKVGAESTTVHT